MVVGEWEHEQIDRLVDTVDGVADAFGVDSERMLLAIGRLAHNGSHVSLD